MQGRTPVLELVREMRSVLELPIVAAGGIAGVTARAALEAGADAVACGTAFLVAHEADVHPAYLDRLLQAAKTDTVLTTVFDVGWPDAPHRVLRNDTYATWESAGRLTRGARHGEGEVVGNPTVADRALQRRAARRGAPWERLTRWRCTRERPSVMSTSARAPERSPRRSREPSPDRRRQETFPALVVALLTGSSRCRDCDRARRGVRWPAVALSASPPRCDPPPPWARSPSCASLPATCVSSGRARDRVECGRPTAAWSTRKSSRTPEDRHC